MQFAKAKDAPGLLAQRLSDFRIGEVEPITEARVARFADDIQRWCGWMDDKHRNAFLTGLLSSLGSNYWSRKEVFELFEDEEFSKSESLHLVHVQEDESSQTTLVKLLRETSSGGFDETQGLDTSVLLYVDDATFTGRALARNLNLLADKIELLPPLSRVLNVFHILQHSAEIMPVIERAIARLAALGVKTELRSAINVDFGSTLSRQLRLAPSTESAGREIVQRFLKSSTSLKAVADGLNEACMDDIQRGDDKLFDSDLERKVVTQAFLDVGIRIRFVTKNWTQTMRPLGYVGSTKSPSFGFGSMFCTFHNSANTSPLALWWGNPEAGAHSALSKWNPLLPRRGQ